MDGDVCLGTGPHCLGTGRHIEDRCGGRKDAAIWRNELYYKFGLATRGIGYREKQVANLVGFEIPFCPAIWASRRKCASLWQPAYGDDATGGDSVAPGALVRVTGAALSAAPYIANGVPWPLHQAESCLCLDDQPVPLGMLSPEAITAQVPWDLEPGEHNAIFFRAGVPAEPVKTKVDQYAPGLFPGTVVRAGTTCLASQENGVRPGETLELFGTGVGPGTPSLVTPKVHEQGCLGGELGDHREKAEDPGRCQHDGRRAQEDVHGGMAAGVVMWCWKSHPH